MRWIAIVLGLHVALGATEASAQYSAKNFPEARSADAVNVDVTTGLPFWQVPDVQIGPDDLGLTHSVASLKASFLNPQDSWWGGLGQPDQCQFITVGTPVLVVYNQQGECFYLQNGVYTTYENNGTSLEQLPNQDFLFIARDGTRVTMTNGIRVSGFSPAITRIERPNGLRTDLFFQSGGPVSNPFRLRTVANSSGFRLYYNYNSDNSNGDWTTVSSVTGYNGAFQACDVASSCSLPPNWPRATYQQIDNGNTVDSRITTASGQTWVFTFDRTIYSLLGRFNRVQLPSSTSPNIIYNYCPTDPTCTVGIPDPPNVPIIRTISDFTVSASLNGQTWSYGMVTSVPFAIIRNSTDPLGNVIEGRTTDAGTWQTIRSPDGTFYYPGTPGGQLSAIERPRGNTVGYFRDNRGNVTQTIYGPVPGYSVADITETSTFAASCLNRVTCNQPITTTDGNGNTVSFEYDPVHGGVLKATGPTVNGIVRETRYSYVQRFPWYLNASGTPVPDPTPIWVLDRESFCRTGQPSGSGCAIAGDEVVTLYDYGPTSGVNNLLLRGRVDDALGTALRTCFGYDRYGNRISETTPNANLTSCP
jgi:YD repeat-containing protein